MSSRKIPTLLSNLLMCWRVVATCVFYKQKNNKGQKPDYGISFLIISYLIRENFLFQQEKKFENACGVICQKFLLFDSE